MKEKLRKIAILTCAVLFAFFSILIQPQQKAEAFALPMALQGAAGVYVIGGLLVAAGAGLVGYEEHGEEIKAHSMRAWDNATQITKDSLNWSIEAATGLGNGIVTLQEDFQNFIDSQLEDISKSAALIQLDKTDFAGVEHSIRQLTTDARIMELSAEAVSEGYRYFFAGRMSTHIGIRYYNDTIYLRLGTTTITSVNKSQNTALYNELAKFKTTTVEGFWQLVAAMGAGPVIGLQSQYEELYSSSVSRVREQWESMRDAGLVLPVDNFIPHSIDGTRLNHDTATGTVTDAGGRVYNPGEYSYQVPNVRWREQSKDIPKAGVYVDLPTYVPGENATDLPKDIPHTTTHITTGTTVGNPDFAVDVPTVPPVPGVIPPPYIPPFEDDGSASLDFTPLMQSGQVMSEKFPFSIPFDLFKQIAVFDVAPEAPEFDINVPAFLEIEQFDIPMKFTMKFDLFDPIANIIRWGNIILFDIGLILMIRRLMPE